MTEEQRTKEAVEAERMRELRKMKKMKKMKKKLSCSNNHWTRLEKEAVRWEEQTDLITPSTKHV